MWVRCATYLQRLADEPAQRVHLGEAGLRWVMERYTMAHVAAATVAVYEQVLKVKQ